jgi:alanine dehydrogenase
MPIFVQMKTIGILRETKQPPDKRTPLTPEQCRDVMDKLEDVQILVQSSPDRCFPDESYRNMGIQVVEELSNAAILLGVKEVVPEQLLSGKTYLFFSHTIKKQAHNRLLLRKIMEKGITLIDYETLVWDAGNRIIGFGRFAGIVGTHHALRMWGLKKGTYVLKPAHACKDMEELFAQYEHLEITPARIVLCGDGRVAHGAIELFKKLKIHHVTPEEFMENTYDHTVYVHLRSEDYYERKDGREWDKSDFYKHPMEYRSSFRPFYQKADILINAVFWKEGVEPFFTREEMKRKDFTIKVISDITCDIPGPLPSTLFNTTINDPYYGYQPLLEKAVAPFGKDTIEVQTIGNLPCELPVDASVEFGEQLIRHVFPNLLYQDTGNIIAQATIVQSGKLTVRYNYLSDFVA